VEIEVFTDGELDPDETIVLELTNASGANLGVPASATITILDVEPPAGPAAAFSSGSFSFDEFEDTFDLSVIIDPPLADGSATVDVVVAGGTATTADYDFLTATLSLVPDQTEAWLSVLGYDDSDIEGDETIILELTNPQGIDIGSPSTTTITIIDDEVPPTVTFSSDTYSLVESDNPFDVRVFITPPLSIGTASVDVEIVGGTATQWDDYDFDDTTLPILPGQTELMLNVLGYSDDSVEGDETIILQLTNAEGAAIGSPSTATLIIIDDDEGASIDPALLAVDLSGCVPTLVGGLGAVTVGGFGVSIDVNVRDRFGGSSWNAPTLSIEGGEPFEIELPPLDLGGTITVTAEADAGGNAAVETIAVSDFPPSIDTGWLDFGPAGPDFYLNFEGSAAITDRLADVRLDLVNTTAVTEIPIDDPCTVPNPSATIPAAPTDEIQLRACHGVLLELCSSVVIRAGGVL
jgi:hypothetical protein